MPKKTFNNRMNDEKKEGYETVKTDMPSERFQDTKQVLTPNELGVTDSSIPGTGEAATTANVASAATKVKSKMKIAPDVSVDELKGKQVGGVPLAGYTGNVRSVAGVSGQSAVDDSSKIPYTRGNYRPDTRYGKKRSDILFEIDNTISEQVVPVVEDSLDLSEAPDSKQGYNGRKQFKQTRSKKNSAYAATSTDGTRDDRLPQQLLMDTSVDFVDTDKRLYTSGQMIDHNLPVQAGYPNTLYTTTSGGTTPFKMQKGNYQPTAFNFQLTNGRLSGISFTEKKIEVEADPISRDQANMNWQIDQNNVAKSMIRLQKELGRETSEKWSPLGYVIHDPYEVNMLEHDIEASVGAVMATAYRAAVSSMAFQKNILAKDGVNPQLNAIKMFIEGYAGELTADDAAAIPNADIAHIIFNRGEYRKGSAAALIEMFDSVGKYQTKADFLGLQRSLSLHLAQADNNINPLHCKPSFIKALDKAHLFSTVSGEYNPMLPIYTTKRIKLVLPLSLNLFCQNWVHPAAIVDRNDDRRDNETGTYAPYVYSYSDQRNVYATRVQHPLVEGLLRWMLNHEAALAKVYGNNATVNIPFEFNFQCPSMFEFLLCSASQDVIFERNISFRDIIFAGDQMTYIWDDLVGLDKLNPLYSTQLTIGKYDEPLKLGKLAADTVIREMWPTHMSAADYENGVGANARTQYFAPWYFNEVAFGGGSTWTENEGFFNEPSAFNMTIPSIRDGVRHEYVDVIKSMDERSIRLSLDRWVRLPLPVAASSIVAYNGNTALNMYTSYARSVTSGDINNLIHLSALRYETNSDGRIIVTYQNEDGGKEYHLDQHSLYAVPKELGYIDDDYEGILAIDQVTVAESQGTWTVSTHGTQLTPADTRDGCLFYSGYAPVRLVSYRVSADANTAGSIDRSAALTQSFYKCFASTDAQAINTFYINRSGIIPCLSYAYGIPTLAYATYVLNGANVDTAHVISDSVYTIAPRLWSMLQRIFFPVNRFENCFSFDNTATTYDPLEACFYFGLCGTLASDFTQDILERLDVHDQLGIDYTEDIFVKESPIFH